MKNLKSNLPKDILFQQMINLFPKFSNNQYKGDNGKIGIIGGNHQYTGAPYFCAMSAMHSVTF